MVGAWRVECGISSSLSQAWLTAEQAFSLVWLAATPVTNGKMWGLQSAAVSFLDGDDSGRIPEGERFPLEQEMELKNELRRGGFSFVWPVVFLAVFPVAGREVATDYMSHCGRGCRWRQQRRVLGGESVSRSCARLV
ncbi:hypothetical protein V8G54_032244 [Vigna mungo]|uniref:Uncharacterized protein n=1 Tax=Vigna mungo TaxID=3915 RepID=A0AAQ3MLK8_VIGMU